MAIIEATNLQKIKRDGPAKMRLDEDRLKQMYINRKEM